MPPASPSRSQWNRSSAGSPLPDKVIAPAGERAVAAGQRGAAPEVVIAEARQHARAAGRAIGPDPGELAGDEAVTIVGECLRGCLLLNSVGHCNATAEPRRQRRC
jgi:hypothetical protein